MDAKDTDKYASLWKWDDGDTSTNDKGTLEESQDDDKLSTSIFSEDTSTDGKGTLEESQGNHQPSTSIFSELLPFLPGYKSNGKEFETSEWKNDVQKKEPGVESKLAKEAKEKEEANECNEGNQVSETSEANVISEANETSETNEFNKYEAILDTPKRKNRSFGVVFPSTTKSKNEGNNEADDAKESKTSKKKSFSFRDLFAITTKNSDNQGSDEFQLGMDSPVMDSAVNDSPNTSLIDGEYDTQKVIDDFLSDDCRFKTKINYDQLDFEKDGMEADEEINHDESTKTRHRNRGLYKETPEQPNLYNETREMLEYTTLMFFLSKVRNLARDQKLHPITKKKFETPFKKDENDVEVECSFKEFFRREDEDCVLNKTVKISEIYEVIQSCHDVVRDDDANTDLHLQMMRTMMNRAGDDAYEVAVFDDSREDTESVGGIIVDKFRKHIVVAFRASMEGNIHDLLSNMSMFQAWVNNPLSKMKHHHDTMRRALPNQHLLEQQPDTILMQSGWYNAIMHDRSKAGLGSKFDFLMKHVYRLLRRFPDYKLCVTGTSLGGALAQVFALHAASEINPRLNKPVKCFSFASPKVGTLRYRRAVEALEELGHLRLLRIINEEDYIRFLPRELTTACCFTGLTTLSLIFNQGLFYRKAGIELNLSEEQIAFSHPKVSNTCKAISTHLNPSFIIHSNIQIKLTN